MSEDPQRTTPPEPPRFLDNLLGELQQPPRAVPPELGNTPPKKSVMGAPDRPVFTLDEEPRSPRLRRWVTLIVVFNLIIITVVAYLARDWFSNTPSTDDLPVLEAELDLSVIGDMLKPAATLPEAPATVDTSVESTAAPANRTSPPQPVSIDPVMRIGKLVLCRAVSDFGIYEPVPDIPLEPKHLPFMTAYVEIEQAKPRRGASGRYTYEIKHAIKLYNMAFGPSEPLMDTAISELFTSQSERRDLHITQRLQASRRIFPGDYRLVVTVTDQVSGEMASTDTRFTIHPPVIATP
jgi:hypothetical protein